MALSFSHGAIQWQSADAATTVYTVSGLSFQPVALRFYWVGIGSATDAADTGSHARRGIGFATSTSDRRCVGSQDQDAAASMVLTTGYRTDCVAMTLTSTPAADGLLDLNSITSDGFTLIVDDASPANITVFWEAWGGSDITVAVTGEILEPAAAGNQDYTVTGFTSGGTDQVVMFAGCQATAAANTAARNDCGLCIGSATSGDSAQNVVQADNNDDASNTVDAQTYARSGECVAMIPVGGNTTITARAQLTQFGTDNFRLNWSGRQVTNRKYIFLAIKGGAWRTGSLTIDANTLNATSTVSGLPFTPIGLSVSTAVNVENTAGTAEDFGIMFMGTGSSPSSRRAMSSLFLHGNTTSEVNLAVEYDQLLTDTTLGVFTIDINAMNADGFQLITDQEVAGEPDTMWIGYLTFGSAAAGTPARYVGNMMMMGVQ